MAWRDLWIMAQFVGGVFILSWLMNSCNSALDGLFK